MTARWGLAALLLLAAGCANLRSGTWVDDGDPPKTKAELFQRFGLPDAERRGERHLWLRYDYDETRGMTFGLRYTAAALILSRAHRTGENVWVAIDDENRVVHLRPGRSADEAAYRLWPFGE